MKSMLIPRVEENKRKNKKKHTKTEKIEDNDNETDSPSKTIYDAIENSIDYYNSLDNKMEINFFGMWKVIFKRLFSYCFCCTNDEKTILMKKTEEKLLDDLDICNILQKLREIDKMKSVLFTHEQLIILGFIPKPEIFIGEKKVLERSGKPPIIKSFKTISAAKDTFPPINRNLLRMFGEDLIKLADSKHNRRTSKQLSEFVNIMKDGKILYLFQILVLKSNKKKKSVLLIL